MNIAHYIGTYSKLSQNYIHHISENYISFMYFCHVNSRKLMLWCILEYGHFYQIDMCLIRKKFHNRQACKCKQIAPHCSELDLKGNGLSHLQQCTNFLILLSNTSLGCTCTEEIHNKKVQEGRNIF